MDLIVRRLALVGREAARSYFDVEIELAEFEQLFGPLLDRPRNMWLAEQQGLVTRAELVEFLAAHLDTFLRNSTGDRSKEDLLMQNLPRLIAQIGDALQSGA